MTQKEMRVFVVQFSVFGRVYLATVFPENQTLKTIFLHSCNSCHSWLSSSAFFFRVFGLFRG